MDSKGQVSFLTFRMRRRGLLRSGVVALALPLVAACGGQASVPTAQQPAAPEPTKAPTQGAAPAQQQAAPEPTKAPTQGAAPAQTPAPSGAAKVKVNYWSHGFMPRVDLDKKYFPEFQQKFPNVAEINYDAAPGTYEDKLQTAMAAGTGPDMYNLFDGLVPSFIDRGFAAEIDYQAIGVANAAALISQYAWKGVLDAWMWKGKYYGIPNEVSNYCTHINAKMFGGANLDPEKDWPKTWDDMVTVSSKLTKRAGDKLTQRGWDFDYTSGIRWVIVWGGMAYQLGGPIMSPDGQVAYLNKPHSVESLRWISDWVNKSKLGGPAYQSFSDGFIAESVAMVALGSWFAPGWKTKNADLYQNYVVKPFPRFKDKKYDHGVHNYAYSHMVNAKAKPEIQQASWQLAFFLDSHPTQYLQDTGLLVPKNELVESPDFKKVKFLDVFLGDMTNSTYELRSTHYNEVAEAVKRGVDRVTAENQDPQMSLDQAQKDVEAIIKQT